MYYLHVYIEKNETLHLITYNWNYINVVNSVNCFLSELEEVKSCIYRVESASAGIRLLKFWHHLPVLLVDEIKFFASERVCKIQLVTRVWNHHSMLTLRISGWRIYNGKRLIGKNGNIFRGKWTKVWIIGWRDTIDYLLERNITTFGSTLKQHQLCQRRPRTLVSLIQWDQ